MRIGWNPNRQFRKEDFCKEEALTFEPPWDRERWNSDHSLEAIQFYLSFPSEFVIILL